MIKKIQDSHGFGGVVGKGIDQTKENFE